RARRSSVPPNSAGGRPAAGPWASSTRSPRGSAPRCSTRPPERTPGTRWSHPRITSSAAHGATSTVAIRASGCSPPPWTAGRTPLPSMSCRPELTPAGSISSGAGATKRTRWRAASAAAALGHRWTRPGKVFRQASAYLQVAPSWNYDGDAIDRTVKAFGYGQFRNFWTGDWSLSYSPPVVDDRLTRGGPLAQKPASWY